MRSEEQCPWPAFGLLLKLSIRYVLIQNVNKQVPGDLKCNNAIIIYIANDYVGISINVSFMVRENKIVKIKWVGTLFWKSIMNLKLNL